MSLDAKKFHFALIKVEWVKIRQTKKWVRLAHPQGGEVKLWRKLACN